MQEDKVMAHNFNKNMRINQFTACVDSQQRITGMSVKLIDSKDETNTYDLSPIGDVYRKQCSTFNLASSDSFI